MAQVGLGRWIRLGTIQLSYDTGSRSLVEYAKAMESGEVDFGPVLRGKCPLCGGRGCIRALTPYVRIAVELFGEAPFKVLVARFECSHLRHKERGRRTFSLLPLQLVPYHRYTAASMLMALLVFAVVCGEGETTVEKAFLSAIPLNSRVSISLLRFWSQAVLRDLRRAHTSLAQSHDLANIRSGSGLRGGAVEARSYILACGGRDPPPLDVVVGKWESSPDSCLAALHSLVRDYSRDTGRFLVGRPFQDRQ